MNNYKEQSYRWVNFIVFLLAGIVNSLPVQTFTSINEIVSSKYSISQEIVTLNILLFPIMHPIMAFPANWILDKWGIRKGCTIGGIFLIIGVWLRITLQSDLYSICLLGSALSAIGNIFILNSPSKFATNWFKGQTSTIILFTLVLINLFSIALGASIPGFIITKQSTKQDINIILRNQAIIVTIPIIIMIIFLKQKPINPPSRAAANNYKINQQNYLQSLKKLLFNKQYLKIMAAMCCIFGTQTALLATFNKLLNNLSIDFPSITSLIILSAMLAGLIGTIVFSIFLRKTSAFKFLSIICCLDCFIGVSILLISLALWKSQTLCILLSCNAGFFLIPSTSLLVMYGSQVAFPIGQGSATGYLLAASQTFGAGLGFAIQAMLQPQDQSWNYAVIAVFCSLFFMSFIFCFLTNEDLKKLDYEQSKSSFLNDSNETPHSDDIVDSFSSQTKK